MANLFLLALILAETPLADLEGLGVYHDNFQLFSWGDEVLLCHTKDNFLLLLDRDWQVLHRYDQAGQGPHELQLPHIFGLFPEKVVVLNMDRFAILDRSLRPVAETLPRLTTFTAVGMGEARGDGGYLFLGASISPFAAWEARVVGDKWQTGAGIFPKSEDRRFNEIAFRYLQGYLYVRRDTPLGKGRPANMGHYQNPDRYEIEVYDIRKSLKENIVQVLGHGVAGLEGFDDKVMLFDLGFKSKDRYYVLLMFINLRDLSARNYYLDTYAENGDFLGRKPVASHWSFRPVYGSDRVVQLNKETLELFAFEP